MTPNTRTQLGGRYLLDEQIAGGGMGVVWRATDQVLGRRVAVKILRGEYADDATFLERFRAEARHAASLSHHGIAAVYDYGEDDGTAFLVMEHVAGEPLSAVVAREGALAPDRVLDVVGQAASALQAAHDAGLVHRDVKPGNLLLTGAGTVKVTDFGIARAAAAAPLTRTGHVMGTAHYLSPEQAAGQQVTPASDIYSLGVVAYECLSGRRPFNGDTPVGVALAHVRTEPPPLPPEIPEPVRDLVARMLAKDPAGRPARAGDLGRQALALRASAARGPAAAVPVTAPATTETRRLELPPEIGPAVTQPVPRAAEPGAPAEPTELITPVRRSRLVAVAGLVVLGLLGLLLVRACAAPDARPPEGTSAGAGSTDAAARSGEDTVRVVAADYLGRPADDVRADLRALGLQVDVSRAEGDGPAGTVMHVSPTGRVERGGVVTLTVSQPREGARSKAGKGHDGQQGHGKQHGHGKGDG